MQTNVSVANDAITGTLKHITGYIGFSSNVDEQSGNYIALKVSTTPTDGATTTVELVGGTKGPVKLDSDMNIVIRVTNKDAQSVKVIATKGTESITKTYSLTGVTLEAAG